jgi:hypothetical protein
VALDKAEFRNRLKAALALHGKELKHLPEMLEGSGVPKHHAARMGRAGDSLVPTEAAVLVLAQRLEVPAAWFEVEDWRPLISDPRRVAGAPAEEAAGAAGAFGQAADPGDRRQQTDTPQLEDPPTDERRAAGS